MIVFHCKNDSIKRLTRTYSVILKLFLIHRMNPQKLFGINIPNTFRPTHCSTKIKIQIAGPVLLSQPALRERLLQLKDQFCQSRPVFSLVEALLPDTAALSGDFDFESSNSYILFQETKEETSIKTNENVVKCLQKLK